MVFSCLSCCSIVHRNHFLNFRINQQYKFSESKIKFRQASNPCKKVLDAAINFYMLIKQKIPLLPRNVDLMTSGELPLVFSTKVNLLYFFYSTAPRCCLLHLMKQNCLLKIFPRTYDLGDSGISLAIFPSRTNLKLHNISFNSQDG